MSWLTTLFTAFGMLLETSSILLAISFALFGIAVVRSLMTSLTSLMVVVTADLALLIAPTVE